MKRIIALVLSLAMLLTGCATPQQDSSETASESTIETPADEIVWENIEPQYDSLDDEELLAHVEDLVYRETVLSLDSDEFLVENVSAVYISKEYLDEVAFNSQSNIYFGYTLAELDELFQGTRYVFTLDEYGQTSVQEFQEIEDISAETMLKNVAIGTGVILVCVTISTVSAGIGAPAAITVIFAASAKMGAIFALSSGTMGVITAGIVKGYQTGDVNEALEAAALSGSERYKWGAIIGSITGGTKEAFVLNAATKNGLTMSEAAIIQRESGLPMDVITQFHSMDEYLVYKNAGLKPVMVNGRTALVQNIDLNYVSQLPDGTEVTNLVRMQRGYAPLDPATGKAYQLHHIGQKADGALAVLTESQHQGNAAILNIFGKESEIARTEFAATRKAFWEYLGKVVFVNGGI